MFPPYLDSSFNLGKFLIRESKKMGKGSDLGVDEIDQQKGTENLPSYTWEEIKNDKSWVVVDGFVYDVTNFSKKHPGGPKIIKNHIGQDASVRHRFKTFIYFHIRPIFTYILK